MRASWDEAQGIFGFFWFVFLTLSLGYSCRIVAMVTFWLHARRRWRCIRSAGPGEGANQEPGCVTDAVYPGWLAPSRLCVIHSLHVGHVLGCGETCPERGCWLWERALRAAWWNGHAPLCVLGMAMHGVTDYRHMPSPSSGCWVSCFCRR